MYRFSASALLILMSCSAHAGLHKWVDDEGRVHYSDSVPAGVTSTDKVRSIGGEPADTSAPAPAKSLAEREAELKKSKQEKEQAEQKKAKQEAYDTARKESCQAAKDNIRMLEEGGRIQTYDADGNRSILNDEGRAQQMEKAQNVMKDSCD